MTTTTVKTYRSVRAFRRDAPRMARQGYEVADTFQESGKYRLRRLIFFPFVSPVKRGKIVVTYQAFAATVMAPSQGLGFDDIPEVPALRARRRPPVRARAIAPAARPATPTAPRVALPPTGREPLQWGQIMGGLMVMAIVCAVAFVALHAL